MELKRLGLSPLIQMAGSVMPHIPESRIYRVIHEIFTILKINKNFISQFQEMGPVPNES